MKKLCTLLVAMGCISLSLFAQDKASSTGLTKSAVEALNGSFTLNPAYTSIGQQQLMTYRSLGIETEADADSLYALLHPNAHPAPHQERPTCTLNKQVYGWHPYWISTAAYNNYDYSLLSTFCYFSYELVPTSGSYSSIHSWKTTASIDLAKAAGARVDLCVTNFGSTNNTTFLGNQAAWATFVDSIKSLLNYRNADGINIDFEGMGSSHRTNFTNFMQYTCNRLHSERPGTTVSIAMYAVDWSSVFDIAALNTYVDAFVVMGYDYHYSGGNPGPVAPLYHGSQWASYPYSYHRTANYYVGQGMSKSKLLMGVPYYGINWPSASGSPGAASSGAGSAQLYNYIKSNLQNTYTNNWDNSSMTPYFAYQSSGVWRQCWWDDEQSLQEKYDMIRDKGLGGIGIWALGYDDGYTQLWDLIANNFTDCATPICSDSFYDTGGSTGNYLANEDNSSTFRNPDALGNVQLTFNSFNVETNFDYLYIYDGASTTAPLLATLTGTTIPAPITSTGNAITVRFDSDGATQAAGFDITWQCVAPLCTPSSTVLPLNNWYTSNFEASFADTVCSSTSNSLFYQVQDYTGTEWRANGAKGFFNDQFNTSIHSDWTAATGTWAINGGKLQETDEAATNSNLYAAVAQDSTHSYLYSWAGMMSGTGTNRRSGLHFFSSNPTLSNRGNGYLVWWRIDQSRLEFYKITNDVLSVVKTSTVTILPDVWYNYQVTYDPQTGLIAVFRDGVFIDSWTDSAPFKTGNAISLRNGNCLAQFDDVQVWQARSSATAMVSVGGTTADVRYQSNNGASACRVLSTLKTVNNYWTSPTYAETHIDWTAPTSMTVNDGTAADIDQSSTTSSVSANWSAASDPHSGITNYSYAIGTTAGGTNVVAWTSVGLASNFTHNGLSLSYNQPYYVSIRATNGAGLTSVSSSDGFSITAPCSVPTGISISNIGNNSATATWTAVSEAVSYGLRYRPSGVGAAWITASVSNNSVILSSLTAGTLYELQVASVCSSGNSAYSSSVTWTTLATCNTPTNLSVTLITNTSARLNWNSVSGASSYTIQGHKVGATAWSTLTATTNYKQLGNVLNVCKSYEWKVLANCATGSSAYSPLKTFTTTGCGMSSKNEGEMDWDSTPLVLYPNPTQDKVLLSFAANEGDAVQLYCYDMSGKLLATRSFVGVLGENEYSLDVSDFPSGCYLVSLTLPTTHYTARLVVE